MNNVNVIRVGFIAPRFQLPDSNFEMGDPIDRSGDRYTLLVFINADDNGVRVASELPKGLPRSPSGGEYKISFILPLKSRQADEFKRKFNIDFRCFCDYDLHAGKLFSVVNTASAKPAYHPIAFCIGDEGSVRYRAKLESPEDLVNLRKGLVALV